MDAFFLDVWEKIVSHLSIQDTHSLQLSNKFIKNYIDEMMIEQMEKPKHKKVHQLCDIYDKKVCIDQFQIKYKTRRRFEDFTFQIGTIDSPLSITDIDAVTIYCKFDDSTHEMLQEFFMRTCHAMYADQFKTPLIKTTKSNLIFMDMSYDCKFYTPYDEIDPYNYLWNSVHSSMYPKIICIVEPLLSKTCVLFKIHQMLFV